MLSWESQKKQYPKTGEPGIHLERHQITGSYHGNPSYASVIDCLLCRDEDGQLVGILNHYNKGNPYQVPGSVNIWVKPSHQRQGIASVLLRDAWHRWELRYEDQEWTGDGHDWLAGLEGKGKINIADQKSLDEELDWREPPTQLNKWWEET